MTDWLSSLREETRQLREETRKLREVVERLRKENEALRSITPEQLSKIVKKSIKKDTP